MFEWFTLASVGKNSRQSFLSSRKEKIIKVQILKLQIISYRLTCHTHTHTVSSNKYRAAAGTGLRTSQSNRQEAQICISGPYQLSRYQRLTIRLFIVVFFKCAIVTSVKGRIFTELAVKTSKSLLNWKVHSWLHSVVARVSRQVLLGRPLLGGPAIS